MLAAGENTLGSRVALVPGGGMIVVADATRPRPFDPYFHTLYLAQLRADGSLEPSFGDGGSAYRVFRADPRWRCRWIRQSCDCASTSSRTCARSARSPPTGVAVAARS
jgi:hypothetical protein